MRIANTITLMVCLNLRAGLAQVQAAVTFSKVYAAFADGPALAVQLAFLFGRVYARWEAEGGEPQDLRAGEALKAELRRCPDLKTQLRELKEIAGESTRHVSETLTYAIGEVHATDLLSQWEGFSRFRRQTLGLEPVTVLRAYKLGTDDPAAKVLAVYPETKVDEAKAEHWAGNWAGEWGRRFEPT